ncbi:MBL fold metallo-hydrolase (plasmid) [Sinorhizobium meliloti]
MPTYYTGPVSDHFDGKRFFGPVRSGRKSLLQILRWRLGGKRAVWPRSVDNPDPDPVLPQAEPGTVRVTMIGHVSCLIQLEGVNLLVDPVWSERASPMRFAGPKRVRKPGLAIDDLPPIDLVLVSHNHYDHLDLKTLRTLVDKHDPVIVTPLGNDVIIRAAIPRARTVALDWDERSDWKHLSVTAVPVQHWSARGFRDRNAALWAGFVLNWREHAIFIAGDTGFGAGWWAQRARRKDRPYDLAILPVGAYEPRWFMEDAHMMPEEAVASFDLLNARHALGCHFGTFNLTDEPVEEPLQRLGQELDRLDIDRARFRTLKPGEAWTVPLSITSAEGGI